MAWTSTTLPRLQDLPLVLSANSASPPRQVKIQGLLTNYDRPDPNGTANTPTFTVTVVFHLFGSSTSFLTSSINFPATNARVVNGSVATFPSTIKHIATECITMIPTVTNVNTSSGSLHWEGTVPFDFDKFPDSSSNLRFFSLLCWFHTPGSTVISPLPSISVSLTLL